MPTRWYWQTKKAKDSGHIPQLKNGKHMVLSSEGLVKIKEVIEEDAFQTVLKCLLLLRRGMSGARSCSRYCLHLCWWEDPGEVRRCLLSGPLAIFTTSERAPGRWPLNLPPGKRVRSLTLGSVPFTSYSRDKDDRQPLTTPRMCSKQNDVWTHS